MSASVFGDYPLGEDAKTWRLDHEFLQNFKRLSPLNRYSEERKFTLREFVKSTVNVEGAMAECGCYEGASAWFMASVVPDADLYLFDSFEGISQPDERDQAPAGIMAWQAGDMRAQESVLRSNLSQYKHIHVMKGWIPERFGEVENRQFRFVHIDVDLYQPTFDSLQFFYPRLSRGGVIVMDDYGFLTCPGARDAADQYMSDKPERILDLPTGQGVIIRQ